MQDAGDVSLEDLIAMEQVARELWRKATDGTDQVWRTLPLLARQAWRNRARMEVTIWRQWVGQP
jgi:hypothetical protein